MARGGHAREADDVREEDGHTAILLYYIILYYILSNILFYIISYYMYYIISC